MKPAGSSGLGALGRSDVALAVVAHPDDESFGLGAVLSALARSGTRISVLCFTHGEASTLAAGVDGEERLHEVREAELAAASRALGLHHVELCDYPDGRLSSVPVSELAEVVRALVQKVAADLLVVFDEGGVTGHPDHVRATEAARTAADHLRLPVLSWSVPQRVADELNTEFGTSFAGRTADEVDHWIMVDRQAQLTAIACHRSQSTSNQVLWRRLELTGDREPLRLLPTRT
ncbi:MAG: PIG-L family deacetylase [Actinomycetota bacterium]|nr:PIG-L family deacetylase [Actinomycetota bacterium]